MAILRKGEQTRAAIVQTALEMASKVGLEGLTIGVLAERMQMSKSGVFAHFGSREDLQIAVLKEYERRFIDAVLVPSVKERRGLPRLRAVLMSWLERTVVESANGCLYIAGAVEYDDRPGAVRDELVAMVRAWQRELLRTVGQAIEVGDLAADVDSDELIAQCYGVILVLHHDARLLRNPGAYARACRAIERLLDGHRAVAPAPRVRRGPAHASTDRSTSSSPTTHGANAVGRSPA